MAPDIYLAGTINKDTISYPDGRQFSSYGGLLYSIIPLAQLLPHTKIIPIVNLGRDCSQDVLNILHEYDNVGRELITIVDQANNHCNLTYTNQESKVEVLSGGVPPLEFTQLAKALSSDLLLMNFISGFDITLETLRKFRLEYNGRIYIDIHSLTLGKTEEGQRYFRKPDRWQQYCACADFLQMNKEEFQILSGSDFTGKNQISFFEQFNKDYLKAMLITCGKNGAYITTNTSGQTACRHIPTESSDMNADTTGCGDIFGAAFCSGIAVGKSYPESIQLAVQTASHSCDFTGLEALKFRPIN